MRGSIKTATGLTLAALLLAAMVAVGGQWAFADEAPAALELADCGKCHRFATRDIAEQGMAHRQEVTCLDCHRQHPPEDGDVIPPCSRCHSDTPHFELDACLACHTNPHTPLRIKVPPGATAACLTCHPEPGEELAAEPSYHSTLSCAACHDLHGFKPQCVSCHTPHDPQMAADGCRSCHRPHKPLAIVFAGAIDSAACRGCHGEAVTRLAASRGRHADLACVYCHAERHGVIPQCQGCHGRPHPPSIHEKFAACGDCHGAAHEIAPLRPGGLPAGQRRSEDRTHDAG